VVVVDVVVVVVVAVAAAAASVAEIKHSQKFDLTKKLYGALGNPVHFRLMELELCSQD
jgi:hypothetical protein